MLDSESPIGRRAHSTVRMLRCALCIALFLGLAACSSGPPPKSFLLEPALVPGTVVADVNLSSIGLITVSVPDYVKESSIAFRGVGAQLHVDESAQWAEAPESALTRTLAESLRLRSGADVLIEPLPRGFEPDVRVVVAFDRLLAETGGVADLSAQIRLISGDGRSLLGIQTFRLLQQGSGDRVDGYFYALSVGLDKLAQTILEMLRQTPS